MTDLVVKQIAFVRYVGQLFAAFPALNITFGEAWRSDETCALYAKEGKGVEFSCHELRLAVDLVLRNGDGAVSNNKSDYQPLADMWMSLGADGIKTCWGGDFTTLDDFYHFSIEHNGVR